MEEHIADSWEQRPHPARGTHRHGASQDKLVIDFGFDGLGPYRPHHPLSLRGKDNRPLSDAFAEDLLREGSVATIQEGRELIRTGRSFFSSVA